MKFLSKNSRQNLIVLSAIAIFLALGLAPIAESAQTKKTVKSTPTPTKKKTTPTPKKTVKATATPKPKTTPKKSPVPKSSPKPKTTPKPKEAANSAAAAKPTSSKQTQLIATAAGARVRAQAGTGSAELQRVKLGTLVKVLEKTKNDWYKVEIPAKSKKIVGWMSGQIADDWEAENREEIYRRIIEKNYKSSGMSFLDASEFYDFTVKAQNELKGSKYLPEFSYKQLVALKQALKAIPFNKSESNPYKTFLKTNEKSIVYSDPSGEWYVRSEKIWDLQKDYPDPQQAQEIAWLGAQNPLPGECEGYVNCYLFVLRETDARYLELYPNGKYISQSLKNIQNLLDPIVSDLAEKKIYNGPSDVSDRAEFNRLIAEIRTVVSKVFIAEFEKQKAIQQLNQIAEAFR